MTTEFPVDLAPLLALTADERVELAHILLDSVTAEAEAAPLTDELKAELLRRREAARANPNGGTPWEEVEAAALARSAARRRS
jgi:putative addiction module component (TIGR02574 family)